MITDNWTPFEVGVPIQKTEAEMRAMAEGMGRSYEEVKGCYDDMHTHEIFLNNKYQVMVRVLRDHPWGLITHLSIKRLDKAPVHDWRDLQRIKNEIVGEDFEAIELYPAERRVVDSANQYHLWVMPEGVQVPLGWNERFVQDKSVGGAVQRPRT